MLQLLSSRTARWIRSGMGLVLLATYVGGCGGGSDATSPKPKPDPVPDPLPVDKVTLLPSTLDSILPQQQIQFAARAFDARGVLLTPLVTFRSSNPAAGTITANGLFVAGVDSGTTTIVATADGISSSGAVVRVSNIHGIPVNIVSARTFEMPLVAGTSDSVAVKVTDHYDKPVAGVPITFQPADGCPGTPEVDSSGVDGIAWGHVTAGTVAPASCRVTASISATQSVQLSWSIGLAALTTVRWVWAYPDLKFGMVGTGADVTDASQQVWDVYGNTTTQSLPLTSRDTTVVKVVGRSTLRGVRGGQAFVVASTGTGSDSVLVAVPPETGAIFGVAMPRADLAVDTTFNVPLTYFSKNFMIGSATLRVEWDPAVMTFVSSGPGYGGVGVVNAADAAAGRLTVAYADGNSSTANYRFLQYLRFKAASTPGLNGVVSVTILDATDWNFVNLRSSSMTFSYPIRTR